MRTIPGTPNCPAFVQWKNTQQQAPQNLNYANLPSAISKELVKALLINQGFLCAYTLIRIEDRKSCHIEHIIPQNQDATKDLALTNLVAAFPADGGDRSHGYGAPIKGGSHVKLNIDFVSPRSPNCEKRFHYDHQGQVSATKDDAAAAESIKLLKLNHKTLIELRRTAIAAAGLTISHRHLRAKNTHRPCSISEARRLANDSYTPDREGRLTPFCVALAQVAEKFAIKEDARSRQLRNQAAR